MNQGLGLLIFLVFQLEQLNWQIGAECLNCFLVSLRLSHYAESGGFMDCISEQWVMFY